ncbi:unnamed protein product [Prorocentrum cordatum]|uniref:Uncharacterized protein n=1 Tax=Prorocentrum cordatum TaxID=2364126 RepID=A0ABN9YD57_9DINO|nr:unnamed protein product [Polarella glacialis]
MLRWEVVRGIGSRRRGLRCFRGLRCLALLVQRAVLHAEEESLHLAHCGSAALRSQSGSQGGYGGEYFEYTPGILRAYVKPVHWDTLTFMLEPVLAKRMGVRLIGPEQTAWARQLPQIEMQLTAAVGSVFVVACSVVRALPRECYIYKECEDLDGLCCPNHEGTMLECCILGAITLNNQHLMDAAESAKRNASAVAREAKDVARKAEEAGKMAEAAREKQRKLRKDVEEAEKEANAANREYKNATRQIKAAKCENNKGCIDQGLTGFCCPTLVGQELIGGMLGCCSA